MNRRLDRLPRAAAAAGCAILLLLSQTTGHAAPAKLISGVVPKEVLRMRPIKHFDGTNQLTLALGLPLRDSSGLDTFIRNLYDPLSPEFHRFLTPAQFAARFGPSAADYEALKGFANSNNLKIKGTHSNRTLLDVEGSVADIEKALHVTMQVYKHPRESRNFIAPDTDPLVDCAVRIEHIAGLDNFVVPRPNYKAQPIHPLSANVPALGSGPGGTYLGGDFRAAYAPQVVLDGTGQSVALLEFDAYFPNDPVLYEQQASLPIVPLTNVLVNGFTGLNPGPANGEVSLDIEMAAAMAPGLSNILVYEATNSGFINISDDMLNQMATDDLANQLSASWSYGIDSLSEQIYKQMAAQGQSFFNASGDSGAYPPGQIPTPSDDTNITVVGGTTLFTTGPGGPWQSEVVWSWFTAGTGFAAGSGGFSSTYALPPWQQGISMINNRGSTTFRDLPDVAMTADNIFVIADNAQAEDVGGTSAASPLWAAFLSLANEQAQNKGRPPVGFINPAIYTLGKGPLYTTAFHDIITGNNTNFVSPLFFSAVVGYDLCTGWGTPTGSNMINFLSPLGSAPILAITTNVISGGNGNGIIDNDECNNLTIILTNEGNAIATGIQGALFSTTPGVIVAQQNAGFPDLLPRQAAANVTPFTISTVSGFVCGTPINLVLVVKSAQVIQTNSILLTSGVLGTPDTFSSGAVLTVPPGNPTGVASPITVSGLESVGKITVSAHLTALFDGGLVLSLVAPNGQSVLLSEFNGGQGANFGNACFAGQETIFDDDAAVPVTLGSAPFVGSFQPQEPLSTFDLLSGTDLNGVWQLKVVDQFPGDTAQLGCWNLNISPEICLDGGGECPGADVSLAMTAVPTPVIVGNNLDFNLLVSNAGPNIANNVVISQTLPNGVSFITTSNYPVAVSQSGQTLNINVGQLPVYGSALISVVTIPSISGLATSVATAASQPANDPNPINNTASATADVTLPGADLAVSMTAAPKLVLQGSPLTYTITVTNNGPFAAALVTLNNTLPANANLLSTSTSQGSVSADGTVALIGTLNPGSNATVTIVVSPTTTGNVTASTSAGLSALEVDPNLLNNFATATVTIGPSADLSVSGFFSPPTILSGATFTNIATLANNGPSGATGVAFSQTIPVGATFLSSSVPGVLVANGVINWDVGAMAGGVTLSITNVLKAPTLLGGVPSVLLSSTLSIFGQPGDPLTNNNAVTLQALVEPPTITITPVSAVLLSGSSDGAIAPGDTVQVEFNLQNTGNINTTNVVATLLSTGGVTLPSPSVTSYGQLAAGAPPEGRAFSFTANGTNGGTVVATLQLTDGSTSLGTVQFTFFMPVVTTFWNNGPIDIPSKAFIPPASGPANPYPSQLAVSNVTGFVSDVSVTISNMSHSYPNDVALLLVGPDGHAVALMVNAASNALVGMVDQTLVFDQNAFGALPSSGQIVSGTYRPADYLASYSFSNAPAGPYTTNLTVFSGVVPNGTWSLYVYDRNSGDSGGISNGWAVTITTITPVNQESDLAATIASSASQATVGDHVTLTLSVTNNGPNVTAAYLTNVLPGGLTFVSTSAGQSTYTQTGQVILYTLGTLSPGAGVTITNVVTASGGGVQTATMIAASTLPDPNLANNSASASIAVSLPFADVAAGISATPNPVVVTRDVTYTLAVTNLGPGDALSVNGSFSLTGLNFVSASTSQGSANAGGGAVQCNFGTVPAGKIATVVVTAAPPAVGKLTNFWTVSTSGQDTDSANNTAAAVVTVVNPSPDIVAEGAALLTQGGNFSNGAINAGETVTVSLTLSNAGTASTANLVAALQANANLTPVTASQTYGAIAPGGLATKSYTFTAQGGPGAAVTAALALTDGASSLGTVSFVFLIPSVTNYSQSSQIVIPEYGPAVPYPSQIKVSGLPGLVDGVTVALTGFTHSFPHDVNVLLADPDGQELYLMSHVGGAYSVTNLTLTFNDSATQTLPAGQLSSGAYLPTGITPLNPLPGVPAAPFGSGLAVFNGTDPNGNWSLYVFDDTQGNAGVIAGGWSLGLTTVSTVNPAARLEAGMVHAPDPVFSGNFLNYLISITNLGPDEASSVVLTDTLPFGVEFSSATLSQGTSSAAGRTVTCNFGDIAPGSVVTANLRVIAQSFGAIVNSATVTTASTDLYLADSTAVNTTTVQRQTISFLEATNFPGGVQLTLLGQASQTYGIQVSLDLLNWTTLSTNTAGPGGTFIFTDSGNNIPARFYRAIRLAQ